MTSYRVNQGHIKTTSFIVLVDCYEEGIGPFVQWSVLFSKVSLKSVGKACLQSNSMQNNETQIYRLQRVCTLLGCPLPKTWVSVLTRRKYTERLDLHRNCPYFKLSTLMGSILMRYDCIARLHALLRGRSEHSQVWGRNTWRIALPTRMTCPCTARSLMMMTCSLTRCPIMM